MLIHAQSIPSRGSYLEIRRGSQVVVARVVWTSANRYGVFTQDRISAEQILDADQAAKANSVAPIERRKQQRPMAARHEASRRRSRMFEFGTVTFLGVLGAFFLTSTVSDLLARPLAAIGSALKTNG